MKITVATLTDLIFNLDVDEELELENFKATCEIESEIPANEILLVLHGRPLIDDKKSLKAHGFHDGDVVILQHQKPNNSPSSSGTNVSGVEKQGSNPVPSEVQGHIDQHDDPDSIRDQIMGNPEHFALLKQNNPPLADAMLHDFPKFCRMIREMQRIKKERDEQRARLMADPFNIEAQNLIAEDIRRKNIDANMEAAMEFNPESFATVCMLYINCNVNGVPVKAFIDSGAQTTIMSTACAERCNVMRLVDNRFSGIAKGVGTQRILGRIHMVQVEINGLYLTTSFSILEDQRMDMLLGLDMLKRHECVIDLQRNVLKIGSTGTEASFLPESELPDFARITNESDEEDEFDPEKLAEDIELAHALEDSAKEEAKARTKGHRSKSAGADSNSRGAHAGSGAGHSRNSRVHHPPSKHTPKNKKH